MAKPKRASTEPDLMGDVRTALADPEPLHLLSLVSALLTALDPRGRDHPFAAPDAVTDMPPREELVAMFMEVDTPETTALLAVIAALGGDDLLRARIRRQVTTREAAAPDWLNRLDQMSVHRAVRTGHILGDGDNIILGVRLAGDQELTAVVYIDHNVGQLVKDAFLVPEPIDQVVAAYRSLADDPDVTWTEMGLADARAWIDKAIDIAAMTHPPYETESWPACRPLIEWITRTLPAGGTGRQRPEWDPAQLERLADRFFASQHGRALDDADHRGLLESLFWFGTDYGPGDPLRWSPVQVEMLFVDWLPRKVIAPAEYLAAAPELLRCFVRFAHAESGVRAELTDETLAAIDAYAPDFQRVIRSPRPQGPAALLGALGFDDGDVPGSYEPNWFEELELDSLATGVGGRDQLDHLDTVPLPDEVFDWSGIPADVAARVAEVLSLTDRCCDDLFDIEYRTVSRRVLARVASEGPEVFRRRGRVETTAAAVIWIVAKANGVFDARPGLRAMDIAKHFGVKSSPSQRGAVMLRAGGFPDDGYDVRLGAPGYLVAARRDRVIRRRDELRQRIASAG